MLNKYKATYYGIIFIFFFILQEVIAFVYYPYSLVSIYWISITIAVGLIGYNLPFTNERYWPALIFTIICVFGAFFTFLSGKSLVGAIIKSIFIVIGFIGFVFLSEKRINLIVFDFTLIFLYIFFYLSYYSFDVSLRILMDGDLFGHSSSNSIAMSLNIVLFTYIIISKQQENQLIKFKILIFSILNLVLVIIQESRAGIVVSSLILVLSIIDFINIKLKRLYLTTILVSCVVFYVFLQSPIVISDFLSLVQLEGFSTYKEDVRGVLQEAFFLNMDFGTFLFGYPDDYNFYYEITRTFNSFLDFWNQFGFIPFFLLIVLLYTRIIRSFKYTISLIYFIPLIFYCLVEALWGATLWNLLIYLLLFYSFKK